MQLLASGCFLTVMFGSVLRRNAKPWSLRVLPIDLGIPPVPIAIFTLKKRTLSPMAELFIKHARAVSKALTSNR
jgi:DNA-binding transcriptional LysR family regulator